MNIAKYSSLSLLFLGMVFPMVWMVRVAFLPTGTSLNFDGLVSSLFTWSNFHDLLTTHNLARPFINSVVVALAVTIGNILFCFMTAYSLSRHRMFMNKLLFVTILAVLFIPSHIVIIPLYLMSIKAGVYDSYTVLIIPWLVTPIGIFLVKQYIDSIPTAMEEAARIDGAGEMRILMRVVMPVCKPVLIVLAIQVFFTNWNSFFFPFILTSSENLRTLPVALALYQGHQAIDWQHLMAGSTLAILPILLLFVILQKYIVSGITAGAIKQ